MLVIHCPSLNAITEKFSNYLISGKFTVFTDNNPLTYILTTARVDATGQRWVAALSDFNFDIVYRSGNKNVDADVLSRYPFHEVQTYLTAKDKCTSTINQPTVKVVCNNLYVAPYVEMLPCHSLNVLDVTGGSNKPMAQIELRELRKSVTWSLSGHPSVI